MTALLAATANGWVITPADSARAIERVYTASLLVTVPLALALIAAVMLRRASAGTRALVWRSAVVALLVVFIGREFPVHGTAWVVPGGLATPLVLLGRMQLNITEMLTPVTRALGAEDPALGQFGVGLVRAAFWIYCAGVLAVLVPTAHAWLNTRRTARRALEVGDPAWRRLLDDVRATLGVRRAVRLRMTRDAVVPATWGIVRPVVLLPSSANTWSDAQRRAMLLHELSHVRANDWAAGVAARVVCALYWFHPGAWWIARGLRAECEVACDDRVLAAGVAPSDYAELLMMAADRLCVPVPAAGLALGMSSRAGLRARLLAVLEPRRDIRKPRFVHVALAAMMTVAIALPVSAVRLAPTRGVLTGLMRDARWESRAYAVLGLAERPDSVRVAEDAATNDPSPQVRAWARWALGARDGLSAPLAATSSNPF